MLPLIGGTLARGVERLCDAVLPKPLEFVGDVASGIINLRTGNLPGALESAVDLFKDAPQQLEALTRKFCREEPTPPLLGGVLNRGFGGLGAMPTVLQNLVQGALGNNVPTSVKQQDLIRLLVEIIHKLVSNATQASAASANQASAGTNSTSGAPMAQAGKDPAAPMGSGKAESSGAPASEKQPAASSMASPSTNGATKSEEKSGTSSSTLAQDARDFLALADSNPDEFMRRVRSGNIPESLKTQAGMQSLTTAVQHLSEMTKMMSQILESMHRMADHIISNMRA